MNQSMDHIAEGFQGHLLVSETQEFAFWVSVSETVMAAGCANGWSMFAGLGCTWHSHKSSSVCLSRHETPHCFSFRLLFSVWKGRGGVLGSDKLSRINILFFDV